MQLGLHIGATPAHWQVIVVCLQNHLISGSLDSTVKVWAVREAPEPGKVLESEPIYIHAPLDSRVIHTFNMSDPSPSVTMDALALCMFSSMSVSIVNTWL